LEDAFEKLPQDVGG